MNSSFLMLPMQIKVSADEKGVTAGTEKPIQTTHN